MAKKASKNRRTATADSKKNVSLIITNQKPILRTPIVTVQKTADGFETLTGLYADIHLKIKAMIRRIAALEQYGAYYIGATENLDTRWSKYGDWEFKHVLYETTSLKFAKLVETDLIEYTSKKYPACNKDLNSKGLKLGASRYYVYIFADDTCKLR
jgi:hypothetical protein